MSGVSKDIRKLLEEAQKKINQALTELSKESSVIKESPKNAGEEEYGITGEPANIKHILNSIGMEVTKNESAAASVTYTSDFDKAKPFQFKEVKDQKGNVFIQVPKAYIKQENGSVSVSIKQLDGYKLPKAFIDENGKELDCFYISKYAATNDEGIVTSKKGLKHYVNRTIDQFRDLARHEGYRLLNAYRYGYLVELFKIEFATVDSKAVLKGVVNRSWDEGQVPSGTCKLEGIQTGYDISTGAFVYRGIENLFGNVWQFLDGIYADDQGVHVSHNNKDYDLFVTSGKNKDKYISGWVSSMVANVNHPGLSLPVGLKDSDKDSYKSYTRIEYHKNKRVCFVGGFWYGSFTAGLFCWYLDSGLGLTSFRVGARLSADTLRGGVGV